MKSKRTVPSIQLLDKGILRLESDAGDLSVGYRLARSSRARHLRLTINRNREVVLTLPSGCSLERGLAFVRTKSEWLRRHLGELRPAETLREFLREEKTLAISGADVPVVWRENARAGLSYRRGAESVEIRFDPAAHGDEQLKDVLWRAASEVLVARTRELAERHSLAVNQVSVRDQISRWGSCSARRNISLNWRLLLLPAKIQDYVLWHELAHLTEMNHSSRFWALVRRYDPKSREHDETLSRLTNRVMMLGRNRAG